VRALSVFSLMHANLIDAQEDASEFEGLVTSIQEKVKEAKRRHSLFWPHPLPLLGLPRPCIFIVPS